MLFIHRDAEREPHEKRVAEVEAALEGVELGETQPVPVVPIRMQEAWLLFDERAIRYASGNPKGRTPMARAARSGDLTWQASELRGGV